MDEYELTNIILDKLNREWDELVRIKNPEIILGDIIYSILKFDSKDARFNDLCISKNIFSKLLPKVFPNKKYKVLLRDFLLKDTGYKKCTKCKVYKNT